MALMSRWLLSLYACQGFAVLLSFPIMSEGSFSRVLEDGLLTLPARSCPGVPDQKESPLRGRVQSWCLTWPRSAARLCPAPAQTLGFGRWVPAASAREGCSMRRAFIVQGLQNQSL